MFSMVLKNICLTDTVSVKQPKLVPVGSKKINVND